MLLKVEPPDGWMSQDGRVLFDTEREAERFAANARLAFSLAIAALMLALSIIVGRWSRPAAAGRIPPPRRIDRRFGGSLRGRKDRRSRIRQVGAPQRRASARAQRNHRRLRLQVIRLRNPRYST